MDEGVADRIVAKLKSVANENGVVTTDQINDAAGNDVVDAADVERLLATIEISGLIWEDPNLGPPVFPEGYAGLRLVQ